MKKIALVILTIIVLNQITNAQQNTVQVIASGDGNTKDAALNAALRHCIEKTFGVFISTNTTISNDSLVKDEIASIASGNIVSYTIITESANNSIFTTTVSATISPENIVKIMRTKGYEFEIKGNVFAQNILKEQFYKEQEAKVILDFVFRWEKMKLFNFDIKTDETPLKNQENILNKIVYKTAGEDLNMALQDYKGYKDFVISRTPDNGSTSYDGFNVSSTSNQDIFILATIFQPKCNEQFTKLFDELVILLKKIAINPEDLDNYQKTIGGKKEFYLFGNVYNLRNPESNDLLFCLYSIISAKSQMVNFNIKDKGTVSGLVYLLDDGTFGSGRPYYKTKFGSYNQYFYPDRNDTKSGRLYILQEKANLKYNYNWFKGPFFMLQDADNISSLKDRIEKYTPSKILSVVTLKQLSELKKLEFVEE